jgi:hypothetical protein
MDEKMLVILKNFTENISDGCDDLKKYQEIFDIILHAIIVSHTESVFMPVCSTNAWKSMRRNGYKEKIYKTVSVATFDRGGGYAVKARKP